MRLHLNMPDDIKISEFPLVPATAQLDSNKKIASEYRRFSPSSIVTLFEIDLEGLLIDTGEVYDQQTRHDAVFRFHNNLKLFKQDIIWRGQIYRALPIKAEGFESTTRGALPVPRITIFSNDEFAPHLLDFRGQLKKLDDLIGGKVTRIKTFSKYLDEANFFTRVAGVKTPFGNIERIVPEDFEPDPLAEFPREVYFIERKSAENRSGIEFELSSAIDFENIKLPRRVVLATMCNAPYRGEGCLYEYAGGFAPANSAAKRKSSEEAFGTDSIISLNLPTLAPPVATIKDELLFAVVGNTYNINNTPEAWRNNKDYRAGDAVFVEKESIKYYFVAKIAVPSALSVPGARPPNINFWTADQCSKSITGCKLRWSNVFKQSVGLPTLGGFSMGATRSANDSMGDGNTHKGSLPFGGFPATNKMA